MIKKRKPQAFGLGKLYSKLNRYPESPVSKPSSNPRTEFIPQGKLLLGRQ